MPKATGLDFETIEVPYNNNLERGVAMEGAITDNTGLFDSGSGASRGGGGGGENGGEKKVKGTDLEDLWISSWIKSRNYKPKASGFLIDGKEGYIECVKLYVGGGGIVGGSLDIPDTVTANSAHIESDGDTYWGCNNADWAADNNNALAYVLKTGVAKFQNIKLEGTVSLDIGTVNNKLKFNITDGLWLGHADFASAPFSVSLAGAIKGESGVIAGWTISSVALYKDGATDAVSSGLAPADYPFYAGKKYIDRATAPFRVTPAGKITGSDMDILGGTIGGFTITATTLYGGIIKTALTVGAGTTGVIMDAAGLRGYDSVLGNTFNLPTDGSAPTFSLGIINETVFEISTNAVLRTSATVGDGSANSAGVLINNTGIYACEANQALAAANLKALINGVIALKGSITITGGSGIASLTDAGNLVTVNEADVNALNLTNAPAVAGATDDTAANAAQATADARITTFFQIGIPASLAAGDLWVDTDDKNKMYRAAIAGATTIAAGQWVIARDTDIPQAITDAATAQSTADGKIVTFYQSAIPVATDAGDMWVDTDDGKIYRATNIGDDQIIAGEWERIDVGATPSLIDVLQTTNAPAAANADVTKTIIDGGMITTGYITLGTAGHIKSGQTAYETGTGWWIGDVAGVPKLSIGNATDYLKWTGSAISLLCSGENAITIQHGSDILLEHGGDFKFTSVPAPAACTATLVATDVGNVTAGAHIYKITYVNATGETELGTASNTVTTDATHKQVDLTAIPKSTSGSVTSRKIYRTKEGGIEYYLLTTIADNTTTTYTDNIADANLTGENANFMGNNSFGKLFVDGNESLSLGINTFVGQFCGISNTTGYYNTATGYKSLYSNTTGHRNIAIGYRSLYKNTTGNYNIAIGSLSLYNNTTGYNNTAIGCQSLFSNTTGSRNTANGYGSLYSNTTGDLNTANGYQSLYFNTTGNYNTANGYHSLYFNTTGYNNTANGCQSLCSNTGGILNTAIGHKSLYENTTGQQNTANGVYSLYLNTTGNYNTANGSYSLRSNTIGFQNTANGYGSLYSNTEGNYNTANGLYSLYSNTTGDYNTAFGYRSLQVATGSYNVALGNYAGQYETGSNAFYVNNRDRTDTAGDKAKSLMYGVMAALAADQKLTINALFNLSVSKTPATAAAAGTAGDIAWDASYIYVCTATDVWKRVGIATW